MHRNALFGELMRQLTAHLSLRQASRLTGISHTTIRDWQNGNAPRADLLSQFCDRMGLKPPARSRLFEVAGLVDPVEFENLNLGDMILRDSQVAAYAAGVPETVREDFEGAEDLPAEDLELLRTLIRAFIIERRRQRGMD